MARAWLGALIAFWVVSVSSSLHGLRLFSAGVCMGSAIAAMHYIGMDAMENVTITYDLPLLLLSIFVSIGASIIALRCFYVFPAWPDSKKKYVLKAVSAVAARGSDKRNTLYWFKCRRFSDRRRFTDSRRNDKSHHGRCDRPAGFLIQGIFILVAFYDRRVVSQAVKLTDNEQRYQSLIAHSVDAIFTLDLQGRFRKMNQTGVEWSGLSRSQWPLTKWEQLFREDTVDLTVKYFRQVVTEEQAVNFNTAITAKGRALHLNVTLIPLYLDGKLDGVQGIARDISEQVVGEQQLQQAAYHDLLTGLPNRRSFVHHLKEKFQYSDEGYALLFLDLNRFKVINDSIGHTVGDQLLEAAAGRLKNKVGGSGFLARLGGDEFTIFLSDYTSKDRLESQVEHLLEAFSTPFLIDGYTLSTSASVGIALAPQDGRDPDTLIKHADLAMYESKKRGPNSVTFFHPQLAEASQFLLQKELDLQLGIDREEFFLEYQPRIGCHHRRIAGVEALVRWRKSDGSIVPPGQFIPLSEETGQIIPLGAFILDQACRQAKQWQENGTPILVSVNLSARQFQSVELVPYIEALLERYQLSPSLLELEVTESMTMNCTDHSIQMLHQLRALGVSLSMDDFGTGYSSLSHLKDFPIQRLKLDRTFVQGVYENSKTEKITQAIIALGRYLDLEITGEGAETEEQVAYLEAHHCSDIQGFYFSKPLSVEELEERYLSRMVFSEQRR
nr:EAL domain-containing protein [Sinobaca sp. H24]